MAGSSQGYALASAHHALASLEIRDVRFDAVLRRTPVPVPCGKRSPSGAADQRQGAASLIEMEPIMPRCQGEGQRVALRPALPMDPEPIA